MTQSVLVVDDDEAVRIITDQMLSRLDLQVTCVDSGAAALTALNAASFDLVLLDVGMPIMSGIEVYDQVRAQLPEQKIIYMTGFSDEELSGLDHNQTWILHKPFTLTGLTDMVQGLLD